MKSAALGEGQNIAAVFTYFWLKTDSYGRSHLADLLNLPLKIVVNSLRYS